MRWALAWLVLLLAPLGSAQQVDVNLSALALRVDVPGVLAANASVGVGTAIPTATVDVSSPLLALLPPVPLPLALPLRASANATTANDSATNDSSWSAPPLDAPPEDPFAVQAMTLAPTAVSHAADASPPPVATLVVVPPPVHVDRDPVATTVAVGVTALLLAAARLYTRFRRERVLDSDPRATIHALVRDRPGATLAELVAATSMSRGALVHHAQMLERHGVLASRHDGRNRRYFLAGPALASAVAPRPPTAAEQRVLDALGERAWTQAELALALGITVQAASYHLRRLLREERVRVVLVEGRGRWSLAKPALKGVDRSRHAEVDAPTAR